MKRTTIGSNAKDNEKESRSSARVAVRGHQWNEFSTHISKTTKFTMRNRLTCNVNTWLKFWRNAKSLSGMNVHKHSLEAPRRTLKDHNNDPRDASDQRIRDKRTFSNWRFHLFFLLSLKITTVYVHHIRWLLCYTTTMVVTYQNTRKTYNSWCVCVCTCIYTTDRLHLYVYVSLINVRGYSQEKKEYRSEQKKKN